MSRLFTLGMTYHLDWKMLQRVRIEQLHFRCCELSWTLTSGFDLETGRRGFGQVQISAMQFCVNEARFGKMGRSI
jgi:hypothetical protein